MKWSLPVPGWKVLLGGRQICTLSLFHVFLPVLLWKATSTETSLWGKYKHYAKRSIQKKNERKNLKLGVKCNSVLEHLLMVWWVIRSIHHGGSIEQLLVLNSDWYNKGHGMCYSLHKMVHIKEPLLSTPCSGSNGFPNSLSRWSFTICQPPDNCK